MTLVILGLDALDAALVEEFDIQPLQLESHGKMETVAHMREQPYTPEAWATIATGISPRNHGVSGDTSSWDNPIIDYLSNFSGRLSMSMRSDLGSLIERVTGAEYKIAEVEAPHMFDDDNRIVHNWPGIHNGEQVKRAWDIMWREGQTNAEFERDIHGLAAEQFGWAREMLKHEVAVAGVHIHLLDAAGHAYCDEPDRLQTVYERAGEFVAEIRADLGDEDDLLVLSDHGMVVNWYDDEDDRGMSPGSHSWRAFANSTLDSVPETAFDVPDWVDRNAGEVHESSAQLDIDKEQLRDLGYI
ncbi:alkaline phosphatase family protein [Halobacterium sp. KA-6]|uniref:alkaline phosphatase family protein n=1 Tax=Halobacterium sp. KA-6 TaxID=2896368 RepID=UPI001E57EEE3|nr:alkaline phosphatase family protein [Halobacterium sp. KA-6]MCD2205033.1 alkaline phosphatase family protein [Halobacterium sp. KA-6]